MEQITEKALKCLDEGKILEDELTRLELAKFLRANPRPKIDTRYLPYLEIEAWTPFDPQTMDKLMRSIGCSMRPTTPQNVYEPTSRYPYKYWYLQKDGSVRIDMAKLKKLAIENKLPFNVSINNLNYRICDDERYRLSAEDMLNVPEDLKNKLAESKEYLKILKANLNAIAKNPILDEEDDLVLQASAHKIEMATPALHDFKDLRKAFYLFKVKGNDGNPSLFVNQSCGLHVNFRMPPDFNITTKATYLKRLVSLFLRLEPALMHIVPQHRIDNYYCKFFTNRFASEQEVLKYAIENYDPKYSSLHVRKENFSFQEFRFVNATSNINQIECWVLALQSICQYAADFDKPIQDDIHIFDVITHPVLQNWFLKRQKHLKTVATVDKVHLAAELEPISKLKLKRNELLKRKSEESLNSKKAGTVNSGPNSRKSVLSASRFANAQAARYRVRSRRH